MSERRRAAAAWSLGGPLVLVGAAWAFALTFRDELPDPVAVHWGANGEVSTDSLNSLLVTSSIITLVLCWFLAVLFFALKTPAKVTSGIIFGTAAFTVSVITVSLWGQRGLTDAAEATIGFEILIGVAIGLALGFVAAWLTPEEKLPAVPAPAGLIAAESADPTQRWRSTTRTQAVVVFAALFVVAGLICGVIWELVFGLILVISGIALAIFAQSTATVTNRGITVSLLFGLIRHHTPTERIAGAESIEVNPLGDYGGLGLRLNAYGGPAFVQRTGEAVKVYRTDAPPVVVTADNADEGAQLLNAFVQASQ